MQGLRIRDSDEDVNATDAEEFNINDYTGYRIDDNRNTVSDSENAFLPYNSGGDYVQSLPLTSAQLALLWDPVLRNRSQNGDLDGCLEILTMLRESAVDRSVQHWERVFSAAVLSSKLMNKTSSSKYLINARSEVDIVKLLETMTGTDNIKPSKFITYKVLTHYADLDDPNKVFDVIKILKSCGIVIDSSISDIIQHMKRFDLVIDMLEK